MTLSNFTLADLAICCGLFGLICFSAGFRACWEGRCKRANGRQF